MQWAIINGICLLSPLVLLWGWILYVKTPVRSDWRSRASLIGLSAPLVSVALWVLALIIIHVKHWPGTATPGFQQLVTIGLWVPLIGMLIGMIGRPPLILAIVFPSIGAIFFWYGTTLF
jgi:hypothetical protein